ncbi:PAS domain S-box-containing protein [Saccharicrinis carchari]|uniref:histidine kinase n=1 Tax=Saccharicrinis carchari TaxID=1168039 RepID=A0A521BXK3_SACCC|nr:PAS domain S-box protein [Saccharicrinis carchari]SMO51765.1 PAS domain S-box-containing protein [Saccharicrinis carchari]
MGSTKNYNNQALHTTSHELNELRERWDVLSELTSEGFFILEGGYCIYASPKGCEILGYSAEEIIGLHATQVVSEEYVEEVQHRIDFNIEKTFAPKLKRKDGTSFFAEITSRNREYKDRPVKIVILRDISDYKLSLQKLTESNNKYRTVIENAGDGIIVGDKNGNILEVNNSFLQMTGFLREELLHKHISSIFTRECLEQTPLRFDRVDSGETIIIERTICGKNGEFIPVEMNSKKPDSNHYLTIARDLRERKKAQDELLRKNEELKAAKDKAEESDRLKSSFLTNMSHEIRTPMNGILGFAELLKKQNLTPEQRKDYLNIILSSGQQLLSIINDVLEISKIETGYITIETIPFDIMGMLKEIITFFKPIAERENNTISINTSKCNLAILSGDPAKIQQVLTNLINNSLKFTRNGQVEVGIVTRSSETMFYVKDTGVGIPPESIDTIFERFTQAQHPGIEKSKGTGLGLSICKKLVEIMDGNIWVESTVGEGSTFYFEIPFVMV